MEVSREQRKAAQKAFRDAVDEALTTYLKTIGQDSIKPDDPELDDLAEEDRPAEPIATVVIDWILLTAQAGYDADGDSWSTYHYIDGNEHMPLYRQKGLLQHFAELLAGQ